jgi:PAS domain S-box-containing protein
MLEKTVEEKTVELNRSEERLRLMIEESPVPMVVFEESRNYFINKKFVEVFGYTIEDIPGVNEWWPLAYPDEEYREFVKRRWYEAVDKAVMSRTGIEPQEVVVTCKDGTKKQILNYFSSIGDLNVSVFLDITERKRAEEAHKASEEKYRELVENANSIIIRWDVNGRITYFNECARKFFGYSHDEIIGKNVTVLVPATETTGRDISTLMKDITRFPERFVNNVNENVLNNGEHVWVSWTNKALDDKQGNIVEIMAIGNDITGRRQAEEALRKSEEIARRHAEELETLMDVVPAAIWVSHDPRCRVIVGNRAGNQFYEAGVSENVSAGPAGGEEHDQTRRFFRDGQELDPEELPMQEAAAKDAEVKNAELDVLLPSGRRMTMLGNAIPLHDADGKVRGSVAAFVDITRRRKMERDLSDAKAQAELYLDLMGHDISNMHQIIMMQLELALSVLDEEGRLEEKDREMLTTSLKTLDRSVNLIGNVRMLQKVRSGEYKAVPLDLGHVIDDAVKIYSDIPGRDVTIKYAPSDGHRVMASPLIKDVLGNLMDNAIKHSKDPVLIAIDVGQVMYKGIPYYRVAVEDNGIGIPDEKKDLIFQRFKRGQTTTKGTGLGLYIVRTLVEGFGGRVEVEDRVGGDHTKGARFIVYLPAAEVKNDE